MRFLLKALFQVILLTGALGQDIDSVWFPPENFTYCDQGNFSVSSIDRYFDVNTSTYKLNITGLSNITMTNLNQQGTSNNEHI
jgi:hypothetical protein